MNYRGFVSEFRAAYEHRGGAKMLACGRLEDSWFAQIRAEVDQILRLRPSSDVTVRDHVTHWTRPTGQARQFSLFNSSGRTDDFVSDHTLNRLGKRLVFPDLKGIKRFANLFGSGLLNLRLNGLGRSSGLGAHEERPIHVTRWGLLYKVRFHLPIYTNPGARMCLDGEMFHFEPGVLYFFNHGCVHAAINLGEEPRYHFVLDCLLSRTLHVLLLSQGGGTIDGMRRFDAREAEGYCKTESWTPKDFTTEAGIIMTRLDYGRIAPKGFDYFRIQRPNVFRAIDKVLGHNARRTDL